jgi:hypothetical protein
MGVEDGGEKSLLSQDLQFGILSQGRIDPRADLNHSFAVEAPPPRPAGGLRRYVTSTIFTAFITSGVAGRSLRSRGTLEIFSTTS